MIFVTVGTDQPFDRMLRVIDAWARENKRRDVFAQVGVGGWKPDFIESVDFLAPREFKQRLNQASLVISHAGMGTILSALHQGKPILVMPKRASFRENRNDHQVATVQRLRDMGKIDVALDETELRVKLDKISSLEGCGQIGPFAEERLLSALRQLIAGDTPEDH